MGTMPRTIRHYPRMKVRGARRRHPFTVWSTAELAGAAAEAIAAMGISFERASKVVAQIAQAFQGSVKALERDPYVEALGREEPPAESPCPTWFTWSAFGGRFDTVCNSANSYRLIDEYDDELTTVPCPMHLPAEFYEWGWGGSFIVPTCARCEQMLPTGTALQMHELGTSLSASAECKPCGKRTWVLMRNYADALGDGTPQWHAAGYVEAEAA